MQKLLSLILCFLLAGICNAQTGNPSKNPKPTLSDQLWDQVETCYSMMEDMDEDGTPDLDELIDDSRNGYLKIAGSWPTCGCGCEHTVGAFKNSKGEYTYLQKESWNCSWVQRVYSNKDMWEVFPADLEDTFIPGSADIKTEYSAPFYLDIDIPRYGTDTKVYLKIVPFGINIEEGRLISCFYRENDCSEGCRSIYPIGNLAAKVNDENTLIYLAEGRLEMISDEDMEIISEFIGNDYDEFNTMIELSLYLQELRYAWDNYMKVQHAYLILGWNRDESRFYIKEKGDAPKRISFREFLRDNRYWGPMC